MNKAETQPGRWHLDKGIPLAFLVMFLGQTMLLGFYGGKLDARIAQHDKQLEALPEFAKLLGSQNEKIVRLEEKLVAVQKGVDEIKIDIKQMMLPTTPRR